MTQRNTQLLMSSSGDGLDTILDGLSSIKISLMPSKKKGVSGKTFIGIHPV
jgi:hypothetical protein